LPLDPWSPGDVELGGDLLRLVPEKNANLLWGKTRKGQVSVTMKKTSFSLFPSRAKKIVFDETGSYVLELMDGQRTGLEIARIIGEAKGLGLKQAEASTREFLQTLQRREIITLRWHEEGEGFCRACGTELPSDAEYCPQCGVKRTSSRTA
jgi:hypothetical protein